jgi:hypothetical protein
VGVWDEYEKNISQSREHFSLQSPNCQGGVACLVKKQKDILDVSSAWTRLLWYGYRTTTRWFIWDIVGSYLRVTLTAGTKKSFDRTIEEVSKLQVVLRKGQG